MPAACKKNISCISLEKNMSVIIDTCIIMNIIRAVLNMLEDIEYEQHEEFERFCNLFKEYLKKMRLCPINQTIITTKRLYENEIDLTNVESSLYKIKKFKKIIKTNINGERIINDLLESYIFYKKKYSINKSDIDDLRKYIKQFYHRQKELSDNDLSLILLAMKQKNVRGNMILTDDIKLIDCIDLIRMYGKYKYRRTEYDVTALFGLTSLYFLGNIYFCCELHPIQYMNLIDVRELYVKSIEDSNPFPNKNYRYQLDNAIRIISRPDKEW